jgi:hypothetical protein
MRPARSRRRDSVCNMLCCIMLHYTASSLRATVRVMGDCVDREMPRP